MAVRRIKNHGKWVWQARVAYFAASRNASCCADRISASMMSMAISMVSGA
jgi:hypothetical protein